MITKEKIRQVVEKIIDLNNQFIVEIAVNPGNKIVISIDSYSGIRIDDCVAITRGIEANFDREVEDYELEVSSAGLSEPFRVKQQYQKNIGQTVEILFNDGQKIKGKLVSIAEDGISIESEKLIKIEKKTKKQKIYEQQFVEFDKIKNTKLVLKF
jgi:ribosome maturation factor RimP